AFQADDGEHVLKLICIDDGHAELILTENPFLEPYSQLSSVGNAGASRSTWSASAADRAPATGEQVGAGAWRLSARSAQIPPTPSPSERVDLPGAAVALERQRVVLLLRAGPGGDLRRRGLAADRHVVDGQVERVGVLEGVLDGGRAVRALLLDDR